MGMSKPLSTLSRYRSYLSDFTAAKAVGRLGPAARPMTPRRFIEVGESRALAQLVAVPTVYVASPLGFSELGRGARELLAKTLRSSGLQPVDPWDFEGVDAPVTLEDLHRIGSMNFRAIEASSALLAVLEGPAPDSGTACELGYALGLGIVPHVLRTDTRGGRLLLEDWAVDAGGRSFDSARTLATLTLPEDLPASVAILDEYEPYLRRFRSAAPRWSSPLTPGQFARRRAAGVAVDDFLPVDSGTVLLLGGAAYGDRLAGEEVRASLEALGLEVLDPGDGDGRFQPDEIARAGRLFLLIDGPEVDVTAAAAAGYAAARGLRVDALRTDPRHAGECPAAAINLQVAHAVLRTGGRLLEDLEGLGGLP